MFYQDVLNESRIAGRSFNKFCFVRHEFPAAPGQIIDHDDRPAGVQKGQGNMATDITSTAGYEYRSMWRVRRCQRLALGEMY